MTRPAFRRGVTRRGVIPAVRLPAISIHGHRRKAIAYTTRPQIPFITENTAFEVSQTLAAFTHCKCIRGSGKTKTESIPALSLCVSIDEFEWTQTTSSSSIFGRPIHNGVATNQTTVASMSDSFDWSSVIRPIANRIGGAIVAASAPQDTICSIRLIRARCAGRACLIRCIERRRRTNQEARQRTRRVPQI